MRPLQPLWYGDNMVLPAGFEPAASALRGRRLDRFDHGSMVLDTGFEPVAFALRGRRLDRFDQPSIDERVVPADRVELSSEPYHGSVLPMN